MYHTLGKEEYRVYKVVVGNPEGKRPLGRSGCRWEDHIKINTRYLGWSDMDWIHRAQDRDKEWALVNTEMNLQVPYNIGKFFSSWAPRDFSRTQHLVVNYSANKINTLYHHWHPHLEHAQYQTDDFLVSRISRTNFSLLTLEHRSFEMVVAWAGRSLFKCLFLARV
jgi:hypothetical protein